jgi:hypothetical protein
MPSVPSRLIAPFGIYCCALGGGAPARQSRQIALKRTFRGALCDAAMGSVVQRRDREPPSAWIAAACAAADPSARRAATRPPLGAAQ